MRFSLLGADKCKERAKAIADHNVSPPKVYSGVAALRTRNIQEAGVTVSDSRSEFLGHADIKVGVVRPANNEPPSPADVKRLKDTQKALMAIAKYHVDPDPDATSWTGAPMLPPN